MIAADKSTVSKHGGAQEDIDSLASKSPIGGGLMMEGHQISRGKLGALEEEEDWAGGSETLLEVDPDSSGETETEPEMQSEPEPSPESQPLPGPELVESQDRMNQQSEQRLESQTEPESQAKQEPSQLVTQSPQQPESQSAQEFMPQPEPEPKPEAALGSELGPHPQSESQQQPIQSVSPAASAVPEGVPPVSDDLRIDTRGQSDTRSSTHRAEAVADACTIPASLTFEDLVPPDLRADLDRATQLEADAKFSEALATYTDCIRRLAPIYKGKYTCLYASIGIQ